MRNFFRNSLLLCVIWALISPSAFAVEVSHLDQARVAVSSRGASERNAALDQAFSDVIVKNTGNPAVLSNPAIISALKQTDAYLTQYGYDEKAGQLYVKGQFDQRRITRLLRQAEIPVWGRQRPLVLIWLSTEGDDGQRHLLSDGAGSGLRQDFRLDARAKGMPMIFPVMDLDDLMLVGEADVRGNFPEAVSVASHRYKVDYFVLATMSRTDDGQFSYQLDLYPMKHEGSLWQPLFESHFTAPTEADAVHSMVSSLTQYFVSQYAVADTGTDEAVSLTFTGIDSQAQLVALEQYVKQLSVAKSAVIAQIHGDKVTFSLELFGNKADLKRQLNLDPRLSPVNDFSPALPAWQQSAEDVNQPLEYMWR